MEILWSLPRALELHNLSMHSVSLSRFHTYAVTMRLFNFKFRLIHKILLANLTVIFLLTLILTSISYASFRNMSSVINEKILVAEMNQIDQLLPALSNHFQRRGNWQDFVSDERNWHHFLRRHLDPHRGRFHRGQPIDKSPEIAMKETEAAIPKLNRFSVFGSMGPPQKLRLKHLVPRLTLLNADQSIAVGKQTSEKLLYRVEILSKQQVVGWLTLAEAQNREKEGNILFKIQITRIALMATLGFILSAIVSYFLAKHFVDPINQVRNGMNKLAHREFDTRIHLNSDDELAELAQYVNQVAGKLESYESQQKQWLQDIAHELRTPLTVIRGEIEAMTDGISPLTEQNLALLQTDVMRLNHLIEDLHQLSVTDDLDLAERIEPIDLKAFLSPIVRRFRPVLAKRSVSLLTHIETTDIEGDASRLEQVFVNLLENCAKYSEQGGKVWLHVTTLKEATEIVIEDSGPGVDDSNLTFLFERLFRVDQARNRSTGGAGLGLAIVRNIIEAHRGTISATHSSKGGLKITITLNKPSEVT